MSGLVQWPQGFENLYSSARQIVPRRGQLDPTKFASSHQKDSFMLALCYMRDISTITTSKNHRETDDY